MSSLLLESVSLNLSTVLKYTVSDASIPIYTFFRSIELSEPYNKNGKILASFLSDIFLSHSKHTQGAKKSIEATYAIKFSSTKYDYTENFATRTEYIPKLQWKKDEMV